MSTPAEIIAARVNGTYVSEEPKPVKKVSKEPVSKETAFPVLGGRQSSPDVAGITNTNTPWGPGVNGNGKASSAAAVLNATSASSSPSPAPKSAFKGTTVQEAFSLDADDQLNVARAEFIKIMTAIKEETNANVECTISQHTKKRTFLISGTPENVKAAKRLVIKKLTKPVVVTFDIPAKVRSRVIGAQGKNLKPIIQENQVRIDIANDSEESPSPEPEDEDDIYARTVPVTIEGDAESTKRAKTAIMAIVKEETKNLSIKITVSEFVKPFVAKAAAPIESEYSGLEFIFPTWDAPSTSVIITGDREAALEARDKIKDIVAALEAKLTVLSVPIPQVKHQFLPIKEIIEEDNVLIQLPGEGETDVKFIGEKSVLRLAQERARLTTSQYKVEVLDMSKAHKGNLPHVRAVAALLKKRDDFNKIASAHDVVINPPKHEFLIEEGNTSLPIEIVVKTNDIETTRQARKEIVALVNKFTPEKAKVIDDIDSFLIPRAPAYLDLKVPELKVEYVTLGDRIVLFDVSEAEESDDFDVEGSSVDNLGEVYRSLDELRDMQGSISTVVMNAHKRTQNLVFGRNRATLRLLLKEVDPDSVEVKERWNGLEHTDNALYIHGLTSSVEKIKKGIEKVYDEDFENPNYSIDLNIPIFVMPKIIGKGGSSIQAIRAEYGVDIVFLDEGRSVDLSDKTAKTIVSVAGNKLNVDAAADHLAKLAKRLADETLARVRVESQYHRQIAGPGFIYMNRLQDKYGVSIRFPNDKYLKHDDAPASKDEITIRGPSRSVAKAEEELKELYSFEKENGHKQSIKIPTKAIARVIGKSGETIKDISDGFGVQYHFNRDKDAEAAQGFAEVELTGSRTALKEASKKIAEIVYEAENFITVTIKVPRVYHRNLVGPGGSYMREIIANAGGEGVSRQQFGRLLNIPDEGSESEEIVSSGEKSIVNKIVKQIKDIVAKREACVEEVVEIPRSKHRNLVGPNGSVRLGLEKELDVNIWIPRAHENLNQIKVTGLPENIEKTKEKFAELTRDSWNEVISVPGSLHGLVSEKAALFKIFKNTYSVDVWHGNMATKASQISADCIPTPPEGAVAGEEDEGPYKFTTTLLEKPKKDVVIPWRLVGDETATAKVAEIIKERLEKAKAATHSGWFYPKNRKNLFNKVLGAQGRNVRELREKTGAFITVPRSSDSSDFIYVVGTEESLKKAEEALAKLV